MAATVPGRAGAPTTGLRRAGPLAHRRVQERPTGGGRQSRPRRLRRLAVGFGEFSGGPVRRRSGHRGAQRPMMQMATSAMTLSATYREAAGLLCRLLLVESVVLGIDDDFSKAEAHRRCVRQFVPLQDDAAKPV